MRWRRLELRHFFPDAVDDIRRGISRRPVWLALAQEDVTDQHRLTLLGPMWMLINYLAFVATFVFVMRGKDGDAAYASYVAVGLLVWFFISELISLSVVLFRREESFVKGTTLPLTVFVMRLLTQCLIRSSYAVAGCIAILLFAGEWPDAYWLCALAGVFLVVAVAPAVIVGFAFAGVFLPDMQYLVSNAMRVGMFLTPIFWRYEGSSGIRHFFYHWNPFTYFIEIVRAPIVEQRIPWFEFSVCVAIGACAWVLALSAMDRFGKKVVFAL